MSKKAPHLDELLDMGEAHARRHLIGGKEQLLPIFHMIYANGESAVVGTPWSNDAEKQTAVDVMRAAMQSGDVIRYSFVCEAWALHVPTGAPEPDTRPSEHPGRVEMVMITACDLKRETMRGLVIKRDAAGNCVDLIGTGFETSNVEGRMSSLLKPDGAVVRRRLKP